MRQAEMEAGAEEAEEAVPPVQVSGLGAAMAQTQQHNAPPELGPEPEPEPEPGPGPGPGPALGSSLLGAIRYGDEVVFQSTKHAEVFAASEGGPVCALGWDRQHGGAWQGARFRLHPADGGGGGGPVRFGDEVALVTEEAGPRPICLRPGSDEGASVLCARPAAGGWTAARLRLEDAAGQGGVVCSHSDLRVVDASTGRYLRAMSVSAELVAAASAQGAGAAPLRHAEAVVTAAHSRWGAVVSATRVLGTPTVHALACASGRDAAREALCLVAASDARSAEARLAAARYGREHSVEEDGWATSTAKVLGIGVGLMGGSAKVMLGMNEPKLPSWRSKKFCAAVMALQTSAQGCPMNIVK